MTTETLRQRAERYAATECISRGEWCALVTELLARIEQLQKDLREQDREFQREARDIAAEERWKATQGEEYGSY